MTSDYPAPATLEAAGGAVRGSILVGVDGSPASNAALDWAAREAKLLDAPLVLCHIHPLNGPAGTMPVSVGASEAVLARAVTTACQSLGNDQVVPVLGHGDPTRALLRLSRDARMLAIGSQGHFTHGALLFAPHAMRIVGRAHCPVIVHPLPADGRGPFRGHVVVGVDGSAASRAALEFGFSYADVHHRPLTAVYVSAAQAEDFWTDDRSLETAFAAEPAAGTLFANEVEPEAARYPRVATKRAVFTGETVPGLLRASAGAALTVVGDRGYGLTRTVLGSVAQQMVGSAIGPVAVVSRTTETSGGDRP